MTLHQLNYITKGMITTAIISNQQKHKSFTLFEWGKVRIRIFLHQARISSSKILGMFKKKSQKYKPLASEEQRLRISSGC